MTSSSPIWAGNTPRLRPSALDVAPPAAHGNALRRRRREARPQVVHGTAQVFSLPLDPLGPPPGTGQAAQASCYAVTTAMILGFVEKREQRIRPENRDRRTGDRRAETGRSRAARAIASRWWDSHQAPCARMAARASSRAGGNTRKGRVRRGDREVALHKGVSSRRCWRTRSCTGSTGRSSRRTGRRAGRRPDW